MAIDVAYEPNFRDFLALNRWNVRRGWRVLRYPSAAMLALFLASPFLFHDLAAEGVLLPYAQSLPVLVLPAIVFVLLPANLYLAAKKRWNAAPEIREPRRFTFSEDGIAVEGATFSARVAWSHVTGAETHCGLVILKTNRNMCYLFPEKGFPDETRQEAFLFLVRKKVSPSFAMRPDSVLGRIKFLEPDRTLDRG